MKTRTSKRMISLFMVLVMLAGIFPTTTFAAAKISATTKNSNADDGVVLTKTSEYDPVSGKMEVTLEAYTTGAVTQSSSAVPTDIVLLVDLSTSMNAQRMQAMKAAVKAFIEETKKQNDSIPKAEDKHSIAMIKFGNPIYYNNNNKLAVGNHTGRYNGFSGNCTEVIADFTTVDAASVSSLKGTVDGLAAGGYTAVDYGINLANELLDRRKTDNGGAYSDRNKVVIVFADGAPAHGGVGAYDAKVAYNAIQAALPLKESGVALYTIGIFDGADHTDTSLPENEFMNYLSSNYPHAKGNYANREYSILPGAEPYYNTYYHDADTENLTSVFKTIAESVGKPQITLGSSASLVDVISDYFTVSVDGSSPEISVYTAAYQGGNDFSNAEKWNDPVAVDPNVIKASLDDDKDTVTVKGFDYDTNYVSATARDGNNYGKKLILKIKTLPNYAAIDAAAADGIITDGMIPTNDRAALLDSRSASAAWVSSPILPANTVTYKVVEGDSTRVAGTYFRFPGAEKQLIAEPTDTPEYSYGDWETTDATIKDNGGTGASIEMPSKDVEIVSVAEVKKYDITFAYRENLPAGYPAVPGDMTGIEVGESVTLPSVTAPAGYTFSGWREVGLDVPEGSVTFDMPAEDLQFEGYFIALPTAYTVEHYLENTDGTYPTTPSNTVSLYANTGSMVTAQLASHHGFHYDEAYTRQHQEADVTFATTDGADLPSGQVKTAADGSLVLRVYYKRNEHALSYVFDGEIIPSGAVLPTGGTYRYGEEVTIAPKPDIAGYTFNGWTVYSGESATTVTTVTMRDAPLVLHGSFTVNEDTPYKVEHYFEKVTSNDPTDKANYELDTNLTEEKFGTTGAAVSAQPYSGTVGVKYEAGLSAASGTITGNGSLVLKLYYSRARHTVTYGYLDNTPGASPLPAAKTYKYGETVAVAADAEADGYTFSGWKIHGASAGSSFTMPAENVVINGQFVAAPNQYTVKVYEMNPDGTYPASTDHSHVYADVFTGGTATATIPAIAGFEYDQDTTMAQQAAGVSFVADANGKMVPTATVKADGSTVLNLYFARNKHKVTYDLEKEPEGVSTPVDTREYYFGQTVTLADKPEVSGYTFHGWAIRTGDTSISGNQMVMPNSDVIVYGSFSANGDTRYTVEHYFEKIESDDPTDKNNYEKDENLTTEETGTTGAAVSAQPYSGTVGVKYEAGLSTASGTIEGDGSLVLTLYYSRARHTVSYRYLNGVPDASDLPDPETYKYGETVPVAGNAEADGYTFSGWKIHGGSAGSSFTMPAGDVEITGWFSANPNQYTVNVYEMGTDGTYPDDPEHAHVHTGVFTHGTATATIPELAGFTYDQAQTLAKQAAGVTFVADGNGKQVPTATVAADGSTVLNLYFKRNQHKVTYTIQGTTPNGVTCPVDDKLYYFGEEVTVAGNLSATGFVFTGWAIHTGDTAINGNQMVMPDSDVILYGTFNPGKNTLYTVEHYFELNDKTPNTVDYPTTPNRTEKKNGETNTSVTAEPYSDAELLGFDYDEANSYHTAVIKPDGSLVLKLYYKRTVNPVIYEYVGMIPANAPGVPGTESYKYGSTVKVAGNAVLKGYTFSGWEPWEDDVIEVTGGSFTMPEREVFFHGSFIANNSLYTVNYFLQNADGTYSDTPTSSDAFSVDVQVDDEVMAVPVTTYRTYSYDEDTTKIKNANTVTHNGMQIPAGTVDADGTLELNLYYKRNLYNLSYAFTGAVPEGAAAPATRENIRHGDSVTLADATVPEGYKFDGWYHGTDKVNKNLTMPAVDTTVTGFFSPMDNIGYTVEYYLEELDGTYTKDSTVSCTGTTDTYVEAPGKEYPGYTVNLAHDETKWNGHVKGDGSLVLKLYYDRNVHTVTYHYQGETPAGVVLPATQEYKYGQTFTVESGLDAVAPAVFRGWYTPSISGVHSNVANAGGTTMIMPDHDVVFYGAIFDYIVSYDLAGGTLNGSDTVSDKNVGWDEANLLPDGTPVKSGYRFTGWTYNEIPVTAESKYSDLALSYFVEEIQLVANYTVKSAPSSPATDGGTAKLLKVDATDNTTVLAGVVFQLHQADGTLVGTYTTNANGEITVSDLESGSYYWREVLPAQGYSVSSAHHEFTVAADTTASITVTNARTPVPDMFTGDHYAYIIGYNDGYVHPEKNVSRGEVATIFFRLLNDEVREQYATRENSFSDITDDTWCVMAVSTMARLGVINGYGDGTFRPGDPITRAEFAAIAARFDTDGDASGTVFTDIYEHWGRHEINIAANNGWVLGYQDGTFRPNELVSRAEAMAMVNRVLQRIPESAADLHEDMIQWPDNQDQKKWYYMIIQEATNSHNYVRKESGYEKWMELRENRDWAALED